MQQIIAKQLSEIQNNLQSFKQNINKIEYCANERRKELSYIDGNIIKHIVITKLGGLELTTNVMHDFKCISHNSIVINYTTAFSEENSNLFKSIKEEIVDMIIQYHESLKY